MDVPVLKEVGNVAVLPRQDLTIDLPNGKEELPKYWDRDYVAARVQAIQNHEHKMLFLFLWMTGVRITEAVSVRKKDLDFLHYTIRVKWQKSRRYAYRVLPMHPRLHDLLQLFTATKLVDDRVFPMSRQRAWQLARKYMGGHPHQFRHSFAVNWLRCGGDVIVLHRMLGHSKLQHTMVYLRIVPVDQGRELVKIQFD